MSAARTPEQSNRRKAPGLMAELADLVHNLARALLDPYRPELHYMRGPGPKWREKHATVTLRMVPAPVVPALIPVRVKR
jgi:hypothetical protein